jgi:hypothetical protein
MLSLLIGIVLGLVIGSFSSVITGISIPVIALLIVKFNLATQYPVASLLFLITAAITRQLLETLTAHKATVLSLDTELSELQINQSFRNNREYVEAVLTAGQSLQHSLYAKINGMRLGYLMLGIPLIILGKILPISTLNAVLSLLGYISIPLLCIGIAVSCLKNWRLGVFICIGGALVWLMLNSPALAGAPSSAPIMLVFSCALVIQHLKAPQPSIKLRWLNKKYIPKLNWYLSLLSIKDWMYAIAGGALPGMTPGFIKAISSKQKADLNTNNIHLITQSQVQGISEMLSLFIVLLGIGNSRTSLSAEAYALLPQASPVVALAAIFLIELLIQLIVAIAPTFVELLNRYKPNTIWHVLIPNVVLLTIALGPTVAIPGVLASIAIGLLHKQLGLEPSQLVTVLSLPTLLVLSPINSVLTNLVF